MIINSKILAAVLIFGATVMPALADGFYGAVDVGQSNGKDICTGNPSTIRGCQNTATLFRVAAGTQISPMWGVEFSYGNYGKASSGSGTISGFPVSADWQATGIQISGIGTFPIANGLSLIGKLGIARTDTEFSGSISGIGFSYSATTSNLAYGIGMQYDLSSTASIRAQYEDLGTIGDSNTTGTTKATLLSAGLVFKF